VEGGREATTTPHNSYAPRPLPHVASTSFARASCCDCERGASLAASPTPGAVDAPPAAAAPLPLPLLPLPLLGPAGDWLLVKEREDACGWLQSRAAPIQALAASILKPRGQW